MTRDDLPDHLKPFWDAPLIALLRALTVGEAEGEARIGKFMVLWVARNRALTPWWWGDDLRTVILFKAQFSCMWFSFQDRVKAMTLALTSPDAYEDAQRAAQDLIDWHPDPTGGCLYYWRPNSPGMVTLPSGRSGPPWANHLVFGCQVGHHDFYRDI